MPPNATQCHPNATQMPPKCHPHDSGALAKLDISSNYTNPNQYSRNRSEGSEKFIRPIAAMLKTNKTIKELSLAGNLNAEAARIFSQDIHDNGALVKLDLSDNSIGYQDEQYTSKGAAALSAALKTNSTIKELNLSQNYINTGAARIFSQAITDMGALASLNLANNKLGPVGAQHLAKVLPTW